MCPDTHKVPQVAHTGPAVVVLHAFGTFTVTTRLMGSLLTTRVGCGADPFSLQGSILCAGSSSLSLRFTLVRVFFLAPLNNALGTFEWHEWSHDDQALRGPPRRSTSSCQCAGRRG